MSNTEAAPIEQAWFRQFWPWFIISIPAATVVACMYTIFLAVSTSDSLVVSAKGGVDVATEAAIAAERFAAAQGMRGEIAVDPSTGLMTLTVDNLPEAARMQALTMDFSHPAFAARDHSIRFLPAISDEGAVFVGQQAIAMDDRWYVVLENDEWRLTGNWNGEDRAILLPRGAQ